MGDVSPAAARMWAADRASALLGIECVSAGDGAAVATMTVTAERANGYGIAHGGLVFALADTAFALACNSRGVPTVAAGGDIVFLRPGRIGELLTASAAERTLRGRSGVYDVTVTGDDRTVVAEFRGRSRAVPEGRK